MKILLSPNAGKATELRDVYKRAFSEAEEIYIASAYLTDWNSSYKLRAAWQAWQEPAVKRQRDGPHRYWIEVRYE